MSRWRLNLRAGPLTYTRNLSGRRGRTHKGNPAVGCLVLAVAFVATIGLCVACMSHSM